MNKNIIVTGSNGQLGLTLREVCFNVNNYNFIFFDKSALDISSKVQVENQLSNINVYAIINCAAYTKVDNAESDIESAEKINIIGVRNLLSFCQKNDSLLIQISTDFVFKGDKKTPYIESDKCYPISIYGKTKRAGEIEILNSSLSNFIIIRTSWLYSKNENSFYSKILHLINEKKYIKVVSDQFGTPTLTYDLANAIIEIINKFETKFSGVYHFSNLGQCSWYDFAKKILEYNSIKTCNLEKVSSDNLKYPARRPKFSVLDKSKIIKNFGLEILNWESSLKNFINKID